MIFELGKYYKHSDGEMMRILGEVESNMYGTCLVGERQNKSDFQPVGTDESNAVNWAEIQKEEWDTILETK